MKSMDLNHVSIDTEKQLQFLVKHGKKDEAFKLLQEINKTEHSILSSDPLESAKFSIVISISLFARAVIKSGISYEKSFNLSDELINKVALAKHIREVEAIEFEAIDKYCELATHWVNEDTNNYHISKAVYYIENNLNKKISTSTIADELSISTPYLSKIFKDEIGMTVSHFIQKKKIDYACELITYTNLSLIDISNQLSFTDQAHFSKTFKKFKNMSPRKFMSISGKHE